MKTYTKTHSSDKALKAHIVKIKARGGSATVSGKTVNYSFPDVKRGKSGNIKHHIIELKVEPEYSVFLKSGRGTNTLNKIISLIDNATGMTTSFEYDDNAFRLHIPKGQRTNLTKGIATRKAKMIIGKDHVTKVSEF